MVIIKDTDWIIQKATKKKNLLPARIDKRCKSLIIQKIFDYFEVIKDQESTW